MSSTPKTVRGGDGERGWRALAARARGRRPRTPSPLPALGLLACVLLLSPAAWPTLAWMTDVVLVLAVVLALAHSGRRLALAAPLPALAAALLLASHAAAPDAWRSWLDVAHWARLALAVVLGALLVQDARSARRLGEVASLLGVVFAGFAVVQVAWLHPHLAATGEGLHPRALAHLTDARANAVFLLPAHLGTFAAVTAVLAAAHAVAAWMGGRRRRAMAVGAGAAAAVIAVGLAGSLSGVLVLGCGASVLAVLALPPRWRARLVIGALLLSALVAGLSAWRRSGELARESPVMARALNWQAAARLARERPLLGHGGGAFALEYPRVRPPGANRTRAAHHLYLRTAAERGLGALVLLGAFVASVVRAALLAARPSASLELRLVRAGVGAAALAALAAGALDFTWSDPTWALPASLVVGAALGLGGLTTSRVSLSAAVLPALVLGAVVVSASVPSSLAAIERDRALIHAEAGRHDEAARHLAAARRWAPHDALTWMLGSSAELARRPSDPEEAVRLGARAVELSPRHWAAHATHARALAAAGRFHEAWLAAARASLLAPTLDEAVALREELSPWRDP